MNSQTKKNLLTLAIAALMIFGLLTSAKGQAPKQHVFYDTVKTVQKRIEYSPDTIPVYFKEVIVNTITQQPPVNNGNLFNTPIIYENWVPGFVIWQTYKKSQPGVLWGNGYISSSYNEPEYYKNEYEFSQSLPGVFLYPDRKTVVKNHVTYVIKR